MNEQQNFQKRQEILKLMMESDKKLTRVQSAKELQSIQKKKWSEKKFEENKDNLKKLSKMESEILKLRIQKMYQDDYRIDLLKYFCSNNNFLKVFS